MDRKHRLEKLEGVARARQPEEHRFKIVVLGEGKSKFYVDDIEVSKEEYDRYPVPKGDIDIKVSWAKSDASEEIRP